MLAEHPSTPRRSRLSLFERAERIGGQGASGWVLYRIVKDAERESPTAHGRTQHSRMGAWLLRRRAIG